MTMTVFINDNMVIYKKISISNSKIEINEN